MCWQSDSWKSHGRPEGDGDATDDWVGRADSWHRCWTETACLNQRPLLIDGILSAIVHEDRLRLHPCCFIYCVLQVLLTCFEFRWRQFSSEKRGCSQEIRNAEAQVPQRITYILQPSKCWPDSGNKNGTWFYLYLSALAWFGESHPVQFLATANGLCAATQTWIQEYDNHCICLQSNPTNVLYFIEKVNQYWSQPWSDFMPWTLKVSFQAGGHSKAGCLAEELEEWESSSLAQKNI